MKITILAVGDLKKGPEKELLDDYLDRFRRVGRSIGLREIRLVNVASGPTLDAEGERLLTKIPSNASVLRLDEQGETLTSRAFATRIGRWRDDGVPDLVFLIGGASGYADSVARAAPKTLAFGPQTWPHRLVKIMLSEQLYRAASLLAGQPYHKD